MDGLFRKALIRGALGLVAGALVGVGLLCWLSPEVMGDGAGGLIACIFGSGVYGAAVMGATVMYDIESWSISRATLSHLVVTLSGLYILGRAQGWLAPSLSGFIWPTLGTLALYVLIWIVECLSYRRKIDRINRTVKHLKGPRGKRRPPEGARAPLSVDQTSKEVLP